MTLKVLPQRVVHCISEMLREAMRQELYQAVC